MVAALCIIILILWSPPGSDAFSAQQRRENSCQSTSFHKSQHTKYTIQNIHYDHRSSSSTTTTSLSVLGTGVASLLAGSVGGAIGVGVAYPLDTLKTKSQVYGQQNAQKRKEQQEEQEQRRLEQKQHNIQHGDNHGGAASVPLPPPGTAGTIEHHYPVESPEEDLISLVKLILEMEGIPGFFGGVKAMMVGQALIKSVAFSANELALGILNDSSTAAVTGISMGAEEMSTAAAGDAVVATSFVTLILAAAISGFVTSFLVAPVGKKRLVILLFVFLSFAFIMFVPGSSLIWSMLFQPKWYHVYKL